MIYVVLELQTAADGTVGTIINTYEDSKQADSRYYQILSAAAVSEIPTHSAAILTNEGIWIKSDGYIHSQIEPTVEPVEPTE